MFAKLKISSRILIVFIGLLIFSLSSGLIYYHSYAQIAPNAFWMRSSDRYFYFDELKNITISKGFWRIYVIPSDSNFLKINAGTKILNYHLISDQSDTSISLSISDSIKDYHMYDIFARVYTNSLENINLKSYANMRIDSAQFSLLNVDLRDDSKLQLKDCQIKELKLNSYNFSTFESESCGIGNVVSSMYDSSYAFVYSAKSIAPQVQEGFSVLMSYDENNEFVSNVSDSLRHLSNSMPEYFDSLKWLMSYSTILKYSGNYENNVINVDYNYNDLSNSYKPKLSRERHMSFFFRSYENRRSIYFNYLSFEDVVDANVKLVFARGLFNSITYTTYADTDSIYSIIYAALKVKYGPAEENVTESDYYEYSNSNFTYLWHDYNGRSADNFTKIILWRTGAQIIIEVNGPYISYENDINNLTRHWEYSLPEFMMDY